MAEWVAGPIRVEAARAFAEWAGRMQAMYMDLVKEGRTPEMQGLDEMNDLIADFAHSVKSSADAAARAGEKECTVRHKRTMQEHRMLIGTGGAMQNYMEVLMIRGVIDMNPSEDVTEALVTLTAGELVE